MSTEFPIPSEQPILSLICPKCGAYMEQIDLAGVAIDRCTNCAGLWFDYLEAEALRAVPGANDIIDVGDRQVGLMLDAVEHIRCPRCQTAMERMVFDQQPTLRFECCPQCYGIFFDAGEFHDFTQSPLLARIMRIWALFIN